MTSTRKAIWVIAGALFVIATLAIQYEVKVAMHRNGGSVSEIGHIKVGQPAPDFSLKDLSNQAVTLSSFRGKKVVLLDFWATWCGPCRMAMPGLQELYDKFKSRSLDPVGRKEFRDVLLGLKQRGKTVFISSHILSEVESVCDRVAILQSGKLKRVGTLQELSAGRSSRLIVKNLPAPVMDALAATAAQITLAQGQVTIRWAPLAHVLPPAHARVARHVAVPVHEPNRRFRARNGLYSFSNPLYFILPDYKDFNVFFQVLQGTLLNARDVCFLSLYALDFIAIMLLLALWRFRTKELI